MGAYKIFRRPVVITNVFVRDPASCIPLLFHVSDIVQFGLTEDLLLLWSGGMFSEDDIKSEARIGSAFSFAGFSRLRMVPEQALTTSWLRAKGWDVYLPYPGYISKKYCQLSESCAIDELSCHAY